MKRSYQAGSVIKVSRQSGDGWRFRFRENGVQRSEWIGTVKALPTKAAAEKAAERFRKHLNTGIEVITVGDLIDRYELEAMPERAATAASYRSIFKRIRERWGNTRLDRFADNMMLVEQWLQELRIVGRHPRPGVHPLISPLFRAQIKNALHLLMEKGMMWGRLSMQRNPLDVVRLKGSARTKEIVILSVAQYSALLDDPELPEVVKVLIQLLSGLGLRISEGLGLKWEDCNFEAGTIQIQRSVVHGQANDTKTASSKTVLPLHENLVAVLKAWKEHETFKSRWVFCSERTSRPLDRDWLRSEYLQPAGERIGLPGLGWHSLRHSYRALLRQSGTPLEAQKNLMRHSKLATTMDIYGGSGNTESLRPANAKVVDMLTRRSA